MNYKLHLIASSNKDDYSGLNYIKVTKKSIYATNSFKLVRMDTILVFDQEFIDQISDKGFFIRRLDWKVLIGSTGISWSNSDDLVLKAEFKNNTTKLIEGVGDIVSNYPDIDAFIVGFVKRGFEDKTLNSMCLDARYLSDLQNALNLDYVNLRKMENAKKHIRESAVYYQDVKINHLDATILLMGCVPEK